MKFFHSLIIAGASTYGAHVIASAVEYHAERLRPFPAPYPGVDGYEAHVPNRAEFEKKSDAIRDFVSCSVSSHQVVRDEFRNYPILPVKKKVRSLGHLGKLLLSVGRNRASD